MSEAKSNLKENFTQSAKVDVNNEVITFDDGNFVADLRGGAISSFFGINEWRVTGLGKYGNVCFGVPQMSVEKAIPIISAKIADIKGSTGPSTPSGMGG